MKRSSLLLILALLYATPVRADIVVESYNVGGVFQTGVGGINPGDQLSFFNTFDSSFAFLGNVEVRDPRTVLPGNGDVRFTANTEGGLSRARVNFDMGFQLADSMLPNSSLIDSEITIADINGDADPTNFIFQFTAQYQDGTSVLNLDELDITPTNGTFVFADFDAGLFQAELMSSSGPASLSFSAKDGSFIRAIQFRNISPDDESDELVISGSRTLFYTAVSEPSCLMLGMSLVSLVGIRRRRIINS